MALSRQDWIRAALFAIADGGTAAVAVEPLVGNPRQDRGDDRIAGRGEQTDVGLAGGVGVIVADRDPEQTT